MAQTDLCYSVCGTSRPGIGLPWQVNKHSLYSTAVEAVLRLLASCLCCKQSEHQQPLRIIAMADTFWSKLYPRVITAIASDVARPAVHVCCAQCRCIAKLYVCLFRLSFLLSELACCTGSKGSILCLVDKEEHPEPYCCFCCITLIFGHHVLKLSSAWAPRAV